MFDTLGRAIFFDVGGFLMPKWSSNGSQMESNFDMDWQTPMLLNLATVSRISLFFGIGGWIVGPKINKKSIPK